MARWENVIGLLGVAAWLLSLTILIYGWSTSHEPEPPAVCERGWVDERTYTSRPMECRR